MKCMASHLSYFKSMKCTSSRDEVVERQEILLTGTSKEEDEMWPTGVILALIVQNHVLLAIFVI